MKSNFIHVCFIIDQSGSMYGSEEDVKGGYARIIAEQLANENGTCAVSIYKFEDTVMKQFIGKDVHEVDKELEYRPGGCTALYDAVGTAIDEIGKWLSDMPEEERPEKNLIVIMTDGRENASREYPGKRVKEMIKHQEEKYNWTFMYLGTDITTTADADVMGIKFKGASIRSKLGKNYDVVNTAIHAYRNATGDAVTKAATMDMCLSAEITASNAEYKADTGIDVN